MSKQLFFVEIHANPWEVHYKNASSVRLQTSLLPLNALYGLIHFFSKFLKSLHTKKKQHNFKDFYGSKSSKKPIL